VNASASTYLYQPRVQTWQLLLLPAVLGAGRPEQDANMLAHVLVLELVATCGSCKRLPCAKQSHPSSPSAPKPFLLICVPFPFWHLHGLYTILCVHCKAETTRVHTLSSTDQARACFAHHRPRHCAANTGQPGPTC